MANCFVIAWICCNMRSSSMQPLRICSIIQIADQTSICYIIQTQMIDICLNEQWLFWCRSYDRDESVFYWRQTSWIWVLDDCLLRVSCLLLVGFFDAVDCLHSMFDYSELSTALFRRCGAAKRRKNFKLLLTDLNTQDTTTEFWNNSIKIYILCCNM